MGVANLVSSALRRYRTVGQEAFQAAIDANDRNIERLLAGRAARGTLLDLGCDDGRRTLGYAGAAGATAIHGVEAVPEQVARARERGIDAVEGDLGRRLPFADASFDAVVSNQVIEHLFDTDLLVSEAFRVVRPGGVVVTSTENLASWHNVAALVMGWQPFSLSNVSSTGSLGNPLALHAGGELGNDVPEGAQVMWQHRRVFAARGLVDLHRAHGFTDVRVLGAGYYPFPGRAAEFDPTHAAFLAVSGTRP